jgi:membrane protein YqaA with SNARE-associated domain
MNKVKLPGWIQHLVATLGGAGLFAVAFLDSSVLSFPIVTDLLVIEESVQNHARMPYYAAMATLGSLSGCIWLYLIAKKSGEALYRRKSGALAERIRGWVKAFVLAEGVFQVPLRTFVIALLLGRGLRYFAEGILAVRYGDQATTFLIAHGKMTGFVTVGVVLILYLIARMLGKEKTDSTSQQ